MVAPWYRPENHPHYENPPVVETAMALEYAAIPGLDLYNMMRLQEQWAAEYPHISDVPGVPPTPFEQGVQEVMFFGEPPKRIWAAAANNGLLVQTQSDRLILNWRANETADPYPGFARTRSEFLRLWGSLRSFLAEKSLPMPIPTMAEFTYVNAVRLAEGESPHDVVAMLALPERPLPGSERMVRFQFVRSVGESENEPFTAQVHVIGETQPETPDSRRLLFTVIARVLLSADGGNPVEAIDAAHGLATYTFSSIVTESKRLSWNVVQR